MGRFNRFNLKLLGVISIFLFVTLESGCMKCDSKNLKSLAAEDSFNYIVERFEDVQILRYKVPGFEQLSLNEKLMIYYLAQASAAGRDIIYDQHYRYNLLIRKVLECIYNNYAGDRENQSFKNLEIYLKKVWFNNGIHDYKTEVKFVPNVSFEYFTQVVTSIPDTVWLKEIGADSAAILRVIQAPMFDPNYDVKRVNKAEGADLIASSAVNFYQKGISQSEVQKYYDKKNQQVAKAGKKTILGLNSTLVRDSRGNLVEDTWKIGGKYSASISQVVYWLKKASEVAPTQQQVVIQKLIDYYTTGNLEDFDNYNIAWVKEGDLMIDFINGFIETYSDPLAMRGSWESVIELKDLEGSKRSKILMDNVQWFENNSPVEDRFKKENAKGVIANVMNITSFGGDSFPTVPLGINLPNAEWIREEYGSKSVTLANIHDAYDSAAGSLTMQEFYLKDEEKELVKKYGSYSNQVHTDMHECLGHASGKLLDGVSTNSLGNYHATLEEARADLFALYYIADPHTVELGVVPNLDVGKAEYIRYINNALLLMLNIIPAGHDIEEDHLRNRMLVARWSLEQGRADNVIEEVKKDGKTYYTINDFDKLRVLFGKLLAEIQRIKSTGDYEAARKLVETYGVKVDPAVHAEVLKRYESLDVPRSKGFLNPRYTLKLDENSQVVDVLIDYTQGYAEQMLECSRLYSFEVPTVE